MLLAGVSASTVTRLCLTHFHGDHCLGVPGVVQRLSLDGVQHVVTAHYPASGQQYFERLRHASVFYETADVDERPIESDGVIARGASGELAALSLDHPVDCVGYRLVEPDGRRLLPHALEQRGIRGPDIGRLQREGSIVVDGRETVLADVSEVRRGQRFAFVMDTRLCDNVFRLAEGVDLLVVESTFLERDGALAEQYGHLTAAQAGRVAAESGVRRLVLTHFSQRYDDPQLFHAEAADSFTGDVVVADDLIRIPMPSRR